ncbi:S8 family serine peptidase [Mycoplasmopsis synoviae]|uniref:S8 family serine peptidase n=1 Tax=Mycoplasmopsis synoviae TaxID=2109 RepID=UPI000CA2B4D9|nr:AprE-like [Mycoplasmopsis synoviae]AQU48298.1 AprE-like [Mycoplasmopsis synoviae]UZF64363.1 S8 family serine peptidase [Mycoplasmopsis synoviae]UZF65034.1 S8 family serine peptidase [Mycoplasmopsis synoviae]UZF65707.1 S8 family serine peptidase [Mycoplasmopsis synoviae]
MSYGLKAKLGRYKYDSDSHDVTKLAYENKELIIVRSAGNDGAETDPNKRYINGGSLASNIIVVGSNNRYGHRSFTSSYGSYTGRQVTLLANGEYYFNNNEDGYNSETSFSAPFISGILSLMLRKYQNVYDLGHNNLIALSTLSASTYNSGSNINENGAGTFDYKKIGQAHENLKYFEIKHSSNYSRGRLNSYTDSRNWIQIKSFYAKKGQVARVALSWLAEPVDNNSEKNTWFWFRVKGF